jgi:branched-chain amino acid transport system ATP-binding protein
LLEIKDASLVFKGISALSNINISVEKGSLHAIIGPNGAGKTSLMNMISGVYKPSSGGILYKGKNINNKRPYQIAEQGIGRVFQNVELFDQLTVLENIMLGRHLKIGYGLLQAGLYFGKARKEEYNHRRKCEEIIEFLEMEEIRKERVGILPFGLRKKVELARALAMEPELLLLDEPVAGMNNEEKEDLIRYVMDIYEETDITILLIEHDMPIVMNISDKVTVLNFGKVIAEGTPEEVQNNPDVIEAYLGSGEQSEELVEELHSIGGVR